MATFTVRPEGIIRQPALTMPGNATGSEAACTSLTASQIRTLLSLSTVSDVTFDIVRATTSVLTPLLNNTNAAALIVGNSTYGISSPGRITASGGITSPHVSYPNTSEQFGYGATAGDYSVSVGRNASSGGNATGVAVGYGATSDYSSVSLGYSATAGWQGVAIGGSATTFDGFGNGAIAIGKSSQGLHDGSIALGYGAITSAANQLMLGAVTVPITQQRFMTGGGSLTFANETGTFLTAANNGLLTLGNSTWGVLSPGHLTIGTDSTAKNIYLDNRQGATTWGVYWNYFGSQRVVFDANGSTGEVRIGGIGAGGSYYPVLYSNGTACLSFTTGGAATFSGDISMQKATQGYIRAYGTGGVNNIAMYDDNTNGILSTSSGALVLNSASGVTYLYSATATPEFRVYKTASGGQYAHVSISGDDAVFGSAGGHTTLSTGAGKNTYINPASGVTVFLGSGVNNSIRLYDSTAGKYLSATHDSTNGIISTSSGNLNLVPTGGTVAVTGGITASGVVSHGAYTVATLPAAGSNAGKMAQVTDSNVAASGNYGATVAAGGANRVKVFSDGTNWVIA